MAAMYGSTGAQLLDWTAGRAAGRTADPSSEVPVPTPKNGEVLVEISATGLNFFE